LTNLFGQVQRRRVIVLDDPWEDGVLREIVERTASERVEEHQVLKVGDLPSLPLVRHFLLRLESARCCLRLLFFCVLSGLPIKERATRTMYDILTAF